MKTFPLLQSQMGVVLACCKRPDSTCYNLPSAIPYPSEIDAERLANAIQVVVDARPILKTRLVKDGQGKVRQYADKEMSIPIPVRHTTENEVGRYIRHGFVRPFNLFGEGPLCRFEVLVTEQHCWLLWDFHHVIADGITIAHHFVERDLPAAYLDEELVDAEMGMYHQAEVEEDSFGGTAYQQAREYFRSAFESYEMTRLGAPSPALDHVPTCSTYVSREAVDAWCRRHHARPHAFLMSVFNIVLAKYSHSTRLAYATLFHGRTDRRLREAYGMFVKTMPVACEIHPTDCMEDAVAEVQRYLFSAIRHSAYPFTHFCHDVQAAPGITFAFQGESILEQVSLDGQQTKGVQLERDAMDGELSCVVYCQENEYEIRAEAPDNGRFPHWAVLVAKAMKNGVEYILGHPETCLGDVDIVNEEEKKSLLLLSQGESMDVDDSETWVDDFLRQVETSPDVLAVSDGTTSLTYSELEKTTAKVAAFLCQESVGCGDFVGVEATPCTDFLVAAIGVMRSGAAYVPIAPQWPDRHRQDIIENAQLKKVLTIDAINTIATIDSLNTKDAMARSEDAAYVIFTSGTTGSSKGVVIPHRALHNLSHFIVKRWRLTASSRISCHSSLAFDGSVEDLFPVLTVGGTVYIMPEEVRRDPDSLHRFIDQHQITGGCYTTAMAPLLAARQHPSLDYLCVGGEKLLYRPDTDCRVYNTYGPTEFTVDATYHELSNQDGDDIPIGRPLSNCAAFVIDPFGMLVPRGIVGELCLQGPQMALGYLHDPSLTEEKFTNAPFTDGIIYHTGDLVRWDEQGCLHYVGRNDHQVKVNGFRIAIDDVESNIASLSFIQQVAVCIKQMGTHEVLCAFFTADSEISSEQMKSALGDKCPAYMIPAVFVQMEKLPLNANGKVDYKRLQMPQCSGAEHGCQQPENGLERLFCQIFAKVLDMETFGVTDDFFQFGGTSIMVMRVMMEAEKAGVHIQYGDVFRYSTPQLLAKKINDEAAAADVENQALADYDYAPLHRFLNNLNNRKTRSNRNTQSNRSNQNTRSILITGATGFLGAHLLRQLLDDKNSGGCDTPCFNGGEAIRCVVRAATEKEAWERLDEVWQFYFDHPLMDNERSRVGLIVGDLTDDGFLSLLEDKHFDLVLNCAADVRHFAQRDTLLRVNTQAVTRLADYCLAHHARLVHISTLSVAGFSSSGKPLTLTDRELYVGQQFHEDYSLSKFLAERVLLERMASQGLDGQIVRIGNLTARQSDGRFQRHPECNAFAMALQVMAEQKAIPQSAMEMTVDISPVDVVAKELAELVYCDLSIGIVHLAHPYKEGLTGLLSNYSHGISSDLNDTFSG